MKKFSIGKFIVASVLALLTVGIVSIHEVHYLLTNHHENDHCENHLHAADTHAHCNVCKFDVSLFTDTDVDELSINIKFYSSYITAKTSSFVPQSEVLVNSLRGPPLSA
jgi:hypothetical protein